MYGWTADEAIGKNADKLLYKEETPHLIEAKKSVIEKGEWMGELRQRTKDDREIIVEGRWTLMRDNKGKPKSILIINTDITEKKKLEAQFLRAQRMESIGTLAGGIAHDLNNVLTPVMLSVQMLNEKYTDEQSQKLLNILQKNTQRGADLIKQVLSFARGIEGERRAVQVGHLVSEIRKVAKETFPKSIEIKTDVSKDLWDIIGDATQLHQVLMNLCVNARDAMPDGGTLTISAKNVSIDEIYARMHIDARVGSYISISVSDTGTGIPPEIMDRIFDPFFTTKEQGKGTGLGLSTVLTIVKSHGGFIDVHSEVGIGTSFKVYLPSMAAAQNREEILTQPELQSGNGESILIVDDEASILDVTGDALEQSGYKVLTASDGVEAISLYVQNWEEIKVVLMDMMMPLMDGPACIHALRKINPNVKIVGVSGLTEKGRFEKNANIQMQAFLTKPYTSEILLKTICEVINTK
jgi:PAS domain S-box-containing protein